MPHGLGLEPYGFRCDVRVDVSGAMELATEVSGAPVMSVVRQCLRLRGRDRHTEALPECAARNCLRQDLGVSCHVWEFSKDGGGPRRTGIVRGRVQAEIPVQAERFLQDFPDSR